MSLGESDWERGFDRYEFLKHPFNYLTVPEFTLRFTCPPGSSGNSDPDKFTGTWKYNRRTKEVMMLLDKPAEKCYTIRMSAEEYRLIHSLLETEYYKRVCDYNDPPKDYETVKKVLDKLKKV